MSKPGQQVLVELRQRIATGQLPAGARVVEIPTAKALGVSRMPVRMALRALEREGLLVKAGARGYMVRTATLDDIVNGIEVRGVLEGLAALRAVERGLSVETEKTLRACLSDGDAIFDKGYMTEEDLAAYQDMNILFHDAIVHAGGNPAIREALARNDHLPFASVRALAADRLRLDREFKRLGFAHMQHHAVFDALVRGQGARAEALMREHANAVWLMSISLALNRCARNNHAIWMIGSKARNLPPFCELPPLHATRPWISGVRPTSACARPGHCVHRQSQL